MADDRTLAPSPKRLERAWRAGLRPRSHWLGAALLLACVAGLAYAWRPTPHTDLVRDWGRALAVSGSPPMDIVIDTVIAAGWLALVFAAIAIGARLAIAMLTGGLGPIDASLRPSLRVAPSRTASVPLAIVAMIVALGVGAELLPVVAGAARAVDAPRTALAPLLRAWLVHTSAIAAAILGVAGLVELAIDRRRRDRSLWQTHAQAREERRERGPR